MDKLIRLTILGTIAGVILAFNMYHADYKLLVAQVGTIILLGMIFIQCEGSRRASLARTILAGSKGVIKNPIFWFFGVCVLSFILSPHKLTSGQELYKVGTWIIFGMIVATASVAAPSYGANKAARGAAATEQIINVWLVCAGVVAIYGILQFFGIDFMKFKLPGGRIVSTFGNATLLAGFLAMTLPVAVAAPSYGADVAGQGPATTVVRKLVYGALIFVLLLCLVLTKSRAGILAGIIGCMIVYILRAKAVVAPSNGANTARTVLIAGLLLIGLSLFLPQIRHIVFDTILRKTARVDIWRDSVQLVPLQPFFGTGIGTFSSYFPAVVSQGVLKLHPIEWEFVNHAHSEYLEILIEMGAVGLAGFLIVIYSILRAKSRRVKVLDSLRSLEQYYVGLFAAFITVLIHNIVSVDLRYTSTGMFFWMMGGILTSVIPMPHFREDDKERSGDDNRVAAPSYGAAGQGPAATAVITSLIIIIAISAIYFTVKPYMNIQQIKEQEFFVKEMSEIDRKIAAAEQYINAAVVAPSYGANVAVNYFELGVLYAKKQDFDKAKECFIKTIGQDYKHAGAFNNLGNIAAIDEDFGRARALFHKALRVEPKNVEYLVNFAYACFKVNVMYEAVGAVDKALRLDPNNSRAILLRRQIGQ